MATKPGDGDADWHDILEDALNEFEEDRTAAGPSRPAVDVRSAAHAAASATTHAHPPGRAAGRPGARTGASGSGSGSGTLGGPGAGVGGGIPGMPSEGMPPAFNELMTEMQDPALQAILSEAVRSLALSQTPGAPTASGTADIAAGADPTAVATASLFSQLAESDSAAGTEHLAKTLEMLQRIMAPGADGAEHTAAHAAEAMSDETIRRMMEEYEQMGKKDDFNGAVEGMLKQLLAKDIMYVPMKQICEKFPSWLATSKPSLPPAEYDKYGKMYQCFQQLVRTYEREPDNFGLLLALMQDLQELGNPPKEIIQELAPGLELGPDGMPLMPNMGPGMPGLPMADGACNIM